MTGVAQDGWPDHLPVVQVRVARPTDRLDEVVAFYEQGLGLRRIGEFRDHAGYSGVMLGLPGDAYHLELTTHVDGSPCPAPTADNLLVLYLAEAGDLHRAAGRLEALGHHAVAAENPYWTDRGARTYADPDGWRVVLVPGPA